MQRAHNLCEEVWSSTVCLVSRCEAGVAKLRLTVHNADVRISSLVSRQDADGRSGLDAILTILARLIDPSFSESAGLCVGDLVLHLLRNAGQHLSKTVPSLLDALARRIAVAQSTIFTQVRSYRETGPLRTTMLNSRLIT